MTDLRETIGMCADDSNIAWLGVGIFNRDILLDSDAQCLVRDCCCPGVFPDMLSWSDMLDGAKERVEGRHDEYSLR